MDTLHSSPFGLARSVSLGHRSLLRPALGRCGAAAWIALGVLAAGCASELACKRVEGQEKCVMTGGENAAIGTGAAAGALWIAGGGCAIGGCRPPMVCNRRTGYCEHLPCGEGSGQCPDDLECDTRTRTCR